MIPRPTRTRHRFRDHAFEVATMTAFTLVGLALVLDPASAAERSPVGRALAGWTITWAIAYLVACPTVLVGILRGSSRLRVAGLIVAAAGMSMQGTAALVLHPMDVRVWTYYTFAAACVLRALVVTRYVRREHR